MERPAVQHFGVENDLPLHRPPPGYAQPDIAFVYVDYQPVLVPAHCAAADRQGIALLHRVLPAAFGHHPPRATLAVKRDVQAAVIERIVTAAALVVGRKDAADKTDYRQPILLVIAERIDIPPAVALRWNHRVEARSDNTALLARCPDKAAIGTPAPGWVAPPAQ